MLEKYKGQERRQHQRVKANFLVIYRINEPVEVIMIMGGQVKTGVMSDLSEGGMALTTTHTMPSLTTLLMNFTLINTRIHDANRIKTMDIKGQVRYCITINSKLHRLGIQFIKINPEDRLAISRFVELTSN